MEIVDLEKEFILLPALCFVPGIALGLAVPCRDGQLPAWSAALLVSALMSLFCPVLSEKAGRTGGTSLRPLSLLAPAVFATGVICGLRAGVCGTAYGFGFALKCCERLKDTIDGAGFRQERTAALIKAFLTGDRSCLDPSLVRVFRESGASHLLALSGLHIGIVYLLLGKLLSPIGNSPAAGAFRSAAIICITGFYVLMTGASPSIVRAFLFICIRESARLLHREAGLLHCIGLALIIQCAVSPSSVRSAGFQLSYLAMLGIGLANPLLNGLYPEGRGPIRKIWDLASLSISCQLFTAPAVWFMFRTFPRYFLICNILAMPVMSLVMYSSIVVVAGAACGLSPDAGLRFCEASCDLLVHILEIVSGM